MKIVITLLGLSLFLIGCTHQAQNMQNGAVTSDWYKNLSATTWAPAGATCPVIWFHGIYDTTVLPEQAMFFDQADPAAEIVPLYDDHGFGQSTPTIQQKVFQEFLPKVMPNT